MEKNIILQHQQIEHIIKRISFQILESCIKDKTIVLAGVQGNGFTLAQKIKETVEAISEIECKLCEVLINKKKPLEGVKISIDTSEYKNKSLVLIDDVLNSGSTLMYCVNGFLGVPLKQFKTAVLVNRNHKRYPVKADFKGISLSTSIQEHVEVEFGKVSAAYLL